MEIIRLVEQSALPVKRTLAEFGLSRSTFYRWYSRYVEDGYDGLANRSGHDRRFWNRIPDEERRRVVEIRLPRPSPDGCLRSGLV
jgi:transposase